MLLIQQAILSVLVWQWLQGSPPPQQPAAGLLCTHFHRCFHDAYTDVAGQGNAFHQSAQSCRVEKQIPLLDETSKAAAAELHAHQDNL